MDKLLHLLLSGFTVVALYMFFWGEGVFDQAVSIGFALAIVLMVGLFKEGILDGFFNGWDMVMNVVGAGFAIIFIFIVGL